MLQLVLLQGAIDAARLEAKTPGDIGTGGTLLRKIVSVFLFLKQSWPGAAAHKFS